MYTTISSQAEFSARICEEIAIGTLDLGCTKSTKWQ